MNLLCWIQSTHYIIPMLKLSKRLLDISALRGSLSVRSSWKNMAVMVIGLLFTLSSVVKYGSVFFNYSLLFAGRSTLSFKIPLLNSIFLWDYRMGSLIAIQILELHWSLCPFGCC
jgi:hypothetical protein